MNKAAKTFVTLKVGERTQAFEITHAERILKMKNNGGWVLPENSEFILTDNGIERRTNKGGHKVPTEKADN